MFSTICTLEPGNAFSMSAAPRAWAVFQPPSSLAPSMIITTLRSEKSPFAAAITGALADEETAGAAVRAVEPGAVVAADPPVVVAADPAVVTAVPDVDGVAAS